MSGRFCSSCGRRPDRETCCWSVESGECARPCPLVPARRWEEWSEEQQFLITLLMAGFGGAAEEWQLLCRLPWPQYRLEGHVVDFDDREDESAVHLACFREPDDRDRGRRYFLTDLARASYEANQEAVREAASFARGYPFGRYRGADAPGGEETGDEVTPAHQGQK